MEPISSRLGSVVKPRSRGWKRCGNLFSFKKPSSAGFPSSLPVGARGRVAFDVDWNAAFGGYSHVCLQPVEDDLSGMSDRDSKKETAGQWFQPLDEHEVTRLLHEVRETPELFDQVLPLVYDDLKRIGHNQRRQLGAGLTMQTTALVHEACLKLRDQAAGDVENRLHLKRLAAMVMRQLIFDYARRQQSIKRGGGQPHGSIDDYKVAADAPDADLILAIEKIFEQMRASNPRMAEVITARFFAGYSIGETSKMMGISSRTVTRDLTRARAWLKTELADFERDV